MRKIIPLFATAISALGISPALGQGVGIGLTTFSPSSDAVLELRSTSSGFLMPRMTEAQRLAISSPSNGLLVYQTDGVPAFYYYNSGVWKSFGGDDLGDHQASSTLVMNGNIISNSAGGEGIRISNDGNVGIGPIAGAPTSRLQVASGDLRVSSASGMAYGIRFENPAGTFSSTIKAGAQSTELNYTLPITAPLEGQLLSSDASGSMSWRTVSQWDITGNTGTTASTSAIGTPVNNNFFGTNDNVALVMATNNRERMRITGAGNLGIGTQTPSNILEIVHNGGSSALDDIAIKSYGTGVNPQLVLQASRGTSSAPSNLVNGDEIGSLSFWGQNGGSGNLMSRIQARYSGNGTTNLSELRVFTSGVERMRMDGAGNVLFASGASAFTPKSSLHLYGNGSSGYSLEGTSSVLNPSEGPEIGFGRGGFSSGLGAAIQFIDYDGYSGGLAFLVHKGVNNGGGGAFADNWPVDVIQSMTLVNNGRIGVGTSDPSEKFQVHDGDIRISNSGTAGEIQFQGTSSGITSFKAGAQGVANINYTLPTTAPVVNGAVLASTTSGVMSWDSFLKPTVVTASGNDVVNPASYNAGTIAGMSVASVPAGTYLVTFNADITRNGSSACQCIVRAAGADVSETERRFEIPSTGGSVFTLTGKVTLGATDTVEIRCRKTSGGAGFTVGKRSLSIQSAN